MNRFNAADRAWCDRGVLQSKGAKFAKLQQLRVRTDQLDISVDDEAATYIKADASLARIGAAETARSRIDLNPVKASDNVLPLPVPFGNGMSRSGRSPR